MDLTRRFTWDDQRAFASLSGDSNPIHMDQAVARRTSAGACVVHGVQSLLWMLEQAAAELPLADLVKLDANFMQFLFLGARAALSIDRPSADIARLELRADGRLTSKAVLRFGVRSIVKARGNAPGGGREHYGPEQDVPEDRTWATVAEAAGRVALTATPEAVRATYPRLVAAIGPARVIALLALTRLVGMVSPGLHSTFHGFAVDLLAEQDGDAVLHYATTKADARFQVVTMAVAAPGLAGTVTASRRTPPVCQPGSAALRRPDTLRQFSGHRALVVGGSRGLGELTAKILAMKGVDTTITYAAGGDDAAAVVRDIRAAGGQARALHLDVLDPVTDLPARLGGPVTSMYFFATCRITGSAAGGYSPERQAQFNRFYVDAFYRLCLSLAEAGGQITVFYPSSAFVAEPTKGMLDYAMAKAAGEVLAADLSRFHPLIQVDCVRLPRLPTDQTAGLIEQELGSALGWMQPIVERVEGGLALRAQ